MELLIGLTSIGAICGAILVIVVYFFVIGFCIKALFEEDDRVTGTFRVVTNIAIILFLVFLIGVGADTVLKIIG